MTPLRVPALGALLCLVLGAGPAAPAEATPLLSEVLYDASGSDDGHVFVELAGAPGTDLGGLRLEGVNGSDGSVTVSVALAGTIPADGLFVVADAGPGGTSAVPGADLVVDFDLQNGPDSLVLRSAAGVLDALGYGVFGPGEVFAGEGAPAPDPPAGQSLARRFADLDTDDNAVDFVALAAPTPGTAPRQAVPEAPLALMLCLAGAGVAFAGARPRRPAAA